MVLVSFNANCPKVGISLELAEDWHTKTSSSPDVLFQHLEASIKNISADIRPSGEQVQCVLPVLHVFCTLQILAIFALDTIQLQPNVHASAILLGLKAIS